MRCYLAVLLIAVFWSNGSVSWAQKTPGLDTLENLKAKALANNPDIPVAEAKVNIAQAQVQVAKAELIQTRHRVGEKVKTHPDIGVAEAKLLVAEAQLQLAKAELVRTRQQLAAKVAVAYAEAEAAGHGEKEGQERLARFNALIQARAISREEVDAVQSTHAKLRAARLVAEARLEGLVGGPIFERTPSK